MDRTESAVLQVAPAHEADKIKEMELFGWSLQNRQEIHEEGDTEGRPSIFAEFNHTYVITTKVYHYIKLHFVRSLNLKHYAEIKRIEDECRSQPFPALPTLKSYFWIGSGCIFGIPGPSLFLIMGLFLVAIALGDSSQGANRMWAQMQAGTIFSFLGGAWLALKLYFRNKKIAIHKASIQKCQELIAQLPPIEEADAPKDTKDCPLCGESIKLSATICRFCNNKLPV